VNSENQKRRQLAERMAAIFRTHPQARAMALVGSVAKGVADDISDIDMTVYYEQIPPRETLERLRQEAGGSDWIFFIGDPEEGGCVLSFYLEGIKCDFALSTIAKWEDNMAEVLTLHKVDSPMQKALSGMLDAIPLFGAEYIALWQAQAEAYPDALAEAMVQTNLKFYPPWVTERMVAQRGDLLFLYQIFTEAERNILGVLMGLNRLYHWGEYKRLEALSAHLPIAPPNLVERLHGVLRDEPIEAARQLHTLIEETFGLVETHLPHLDIAEARNRYRRPHGT
jgi:predicted nucleotidyltransferase